MEFTTHHLFPSQAKKTSNNNIGCLFYVVLFSLGVFVKCDTSPGNNYQPSPSDTTRTVALYQRPLQGDIILDEVYRVTLDTFKIVKRDTLPDGIKEKREWRRDSLYFTKFRLDTLRNQQGQILFDSLSKLPITQWSFQPHPRNLIVHDFNYQMKSLKQ